MRRALLVWNQIIPTASRNSSVRPLAATFCRNGAYNEAHLSINPGGIGMPQATFRFPTGFLWGAATAAHQVEGNNTNNNWSAWEQGEGNIIHGDRSGQACDWWQGGRWKEDFDRAAETGQNAHRMSIEWSRIQPAEDRWDEDALDHYREIIRGMFERGLTPMVTLHHFTDPLWLTEKGGWEFDGVVELFATFTRRVVEALKEYVPYWITINEPNVYTYSGYLGGGFPPNHNNIGAAAIVMANLLRGHAAAYRTIHAIQPGARVGYAHHHRPMRPAKPGFPPDMWAARFLSKNWNDSFADGITSGRFNFILHSVAVPEARGTQDFVGLNYYSVEMVTFRPLAFDNFFHSRSFPKGPAMSESNFIANVPYGLFESLRWAKRFNLPILVTENGVEDSKDTLRPRYIAEHVHQMWRATNFNWQIKGYFHWSLVDNFEWERGWSQRFGLWGLDAATQTRIRRPSVDLYEAICRQNALSYDMVERYAPQSIPVIFPD